MKIDLQIKKYESNTIEFEAEGKTFNIDMSLAWGKDWTELNEYQQCFIVFIAICSKIALGLKSMQLV